MWLQATRLTAPQVNNTPMEPLPLFSVCHTRTHMHTPMHTHTHAQEALYLYIVKLVVIILFPRELQR